MSAAKKRMLLGAAILPTLVVLLMGRAQAQFPRPGGPGGINMPQIPRPNFPNPPGINMPQIPRPNFPNPPGINMPQIPRPNFPNQPGFNPSINPPGINIPQIRVPDPIRIEKVWKCEGCGANLGNGAFPTSPCPGCGARIINGIGGGINRSPAFQPIRPPANLPVVRTPNTKPVAGPAANDSGSLSTAKVFYILGAVIGLAMTIAGAIVAVKYST